MTKMSLSPNNSFLVLFVASVTAAMMPPSVSGQTPGATKSPKRQPVATKQDHLENTGSMRGVDIDELIDMLGSPNFSDRKDATHVLKQRGTEVLPPLRRAYHRVDDMEVRLRIEGIVHKIFYRESLRTNVGWLGIRMEQAFRQIRKIKSPLPAGQTGIHLAEVTRDGPAGIAGLTVGDIIIAIDNEPLTGNTSQAFGLLRHTVQRRGPGGHLSLTFLRGNKKMTVQVVLGYATPQILRAPELRTKYNKAVSTANERFPVWWRQFCGSPDNPISFEIERLTTDLDFERKP